MSILTKKPITSAHNQHKTLTWTQEKASGEAEVPEYTDRESDCNCIQVHPILQVACLSRDVRSSPLGGAHNPISNQGQTRSPSPLLGSIFIFLVCFLFHSLSSHFGACWSTGICLVKRLLQEIQRRIIEDAYQSTQFHTVSMPFEVCFVCVWGFFTTRVHKTERSKIQHYERTCDWHGVLLVEDRCRTTSWQGAAGRQGSSTAWILVCEPGRKWDTCLNAHTKE